MQKDTVTETLPRKRIRPRWALLTSFAIPPLILLVLLLDMALT